MNINTLHTTRSATFGFPANILICMILGLLGSVLLLGQVYGEPSEALYIDADGNVGIGTHIPAAKLDVKGTLNAQSLYVAESIGTRGKITAQELKVAGSVNAAQVSVAGVINAQRIMAQGTIDFSPHWDCGNKVILPAPQPDV